MSGEGGGGEGVANRRQRGLCFCVGADKLIKCRLLLTNYSTSKKKMKMKKKRKIKICSVVSRRSLLSCCSFCFLKQISSSFNEIATNSWFRSCCCCCCCWRANKQKLCSCCCYSTYSTYTYTHIHMQCVYSHNCKCKLCLHLKLIEMNARKNNA